MRFLVKRTSQCSFSADAKPDDEARPGPVIPYPSGTGEDHLWYIDLESLDDLMRLCGGAEVVLNAYYPTDNFPAEWQLPILEIYDDHRE